MPIIKFHKNKRTDAERREKQGAKVVRIIRVHRLMRGKTQLSADDAEAVANELRVSARTVYRDWKVLQEAYKQLGPNFD